MLPPSFSRRTLATLFAPSYAPAMSLPKAVIAVPVPEATLARLAAGCQPLVGVNPGDRAALRAALADAEGVLSPAPTPYDAAFLDGFPRLRVISNFGVGFNNVDLEDCTRRGIAVCNTPGVLSVAVAELALLLILAAARRFPANAAHSSGGGWSAGSPAPPLGFDITGKTLGLVGYGRIAKETAIRARAFGMRVVYYDAFPVGDDGHATPLPLDDLLRTSDFVSLHVNLTPETHHVLSAREFALMKPSAWLVNTSRGPVVDQAALTAALLAAQIAGAALDVLEVEPPDPADPLLTMPNVITLPHIGTATTETRAAMLEMSVSNLLMVLGGEPPLSCVNPEALPRAMQRR